MEKHYYDQRMGVHQPCWCETYVKLKEDAVVWVKVLERHRTRFLQADGVGQGGCALVCARGDEGSFWGPGRTAQVNIKSIAAHLGIFHDTA